MAALRRPLSLLLVLVLAMGALLVGCTPAATDTTPPPGNASNGDTGEEPPKTEDLPYAKIIWYTVGDQHADHDEVWGRFNEMLKQKMNTEVDIKFTTWTDWQTKYNVLLTSGEQIDGIFAAN
ncbi:MAG: hypothetical protein PHO66_01765, partial [Eubacteriales bacterium]|nr:hypothetical protein [Eubacteriales bacterium]